MKQYHDLLRHILDNGRDREDRTGVGTRGVFGYQMRFDLRQGLPVVTTKKLHLRSIIVELCWFLQGRTDNAWLKERGVSIWDEWATEAQCAKFDRPAGDLGPVYGHQWRNFGATSNLSGGYNQDGYDQIRWVFEEMKKNPNSRRLIVSGWNPKEQGQVTLPPCHTMFQFYIQDGELSCQLYQRSADSFLGVPFNIASYAILTHVFAQCLGLKVGDFVHTLGDAHLYRNHLDLARLQLTRECRPLPTLRVDSSLTEPWDLRPEDLELVGYDPHPGIKAEVAV